MSNAEKLKKKAAEFEQKKQFDRALEVYLQIIGLSEGQEDRDVTVYNRVGDLYLRLNKTNEAVNYYEQAVDLYTEGGYLNNAIALCNKILRHAPQRHQIYYKLGKISAKKGFNSDAKKNFLEYADRMHRAGRDGDAFKALEEFADLCPGQDDIRLMLADQLAKAGKTAEAIEQLQILHESLDAEGRTAEAEATVQRIQTLDPSVEPRRSKTPVKRDSGGLVFLDVGGSPAKPRPKHPDAPRTPIAPKARARQQTPPHVQPSPEFEQLADLEVPEIEGIPDLEPLPGLEHLPENEHLPDLEPLLDLEPTTPESVPAMEFETNSIPDIETGSTVSGLEPAFDLSITETDFSPLEGLESAADPSQFIMDPEIGPGLSPLEGLISSDSDSSPNDPGLGEPLATADPLAGLNVLEDSRYFVHEPAPEESTNSVHAEIPGIETIELESEEEPQVRHETPAPVPAPKSKHKTPPRKQPEPLAREEEEEEEEEKEEQEQEQKQKQKVEQRPREQELEERPAGKSRREERKDEEEEERPAAKSRREEHEDEEEAPAPQPSRPKLVEPLRMTRPKPKKGKTPQREEPAPERRQAVNPFMRRAKHKSPVPKPAPRQPTPPTEVPRGATPKENAQQRNSDDNFVDLADWLREERGPRSTRMVAQEDHTRAEGEQADFTDMLEKFKAGVAANVDEEDFDSHYDLGVAYKEMGLIDEAVAEFQKALRGATQRIRAYEALGQCFIERNEHDVAITVLGRALREPGMEDEDLIGVLYLLGFASEGSKKARDAAAYYQRVFAIDIDFRDVSKRLKQMSKAASK